MTPVGSYAAPHSYSQGVYSPTWVPPTTASYTPRWTTPVRSSYPYVALSQIPYTGFDYGPVGNALYWLALVLFAALGAYLIVFYKGGALAFSSVLLGGFSLPERTHAHEEGKEHPMIVAMREKVAEREESNPVAAHAGDAMSFETLDGEAPRIIVTRNS